MLMSQQSRYEYRREWAKRNPAKHAGYQMKYRTKIPGMSLYRTAKQRAKTKGITFTIEFADLVFLDRCPILDIPLKSYSGHVDKRPGGRFDSYSIDRIDPTKGYITGNVQVISHLANMMKSAATPEQLLKFAAWVGKTYE